ncbi:MAG: hypothetical protein ACLR8M_03805 [Oscillospiraceae bacterium]
MRAFHFKAEYQKLLTPEVVAYLTQIHEYKGQQNLFIEAKADALSSLLEVARIQSTEASNRIEGIITTDDRLKKSSAKRPCPRPAARRRLPDTAMCLQRFMKAMTIFRLGRPLSCSFIGICTSTAISPSAAASKTRIM